MGFIKLCLQRKNDKYIHVNRGGINLIEKKLLNMIDDFSIKVKIYRFRNNFPYDHEIITLS